MTNGDTVSTMQLGFDSLLENSDTENRERKLAWQTAHLPDTMEEGLAHYRLLIRRHHAAMLAADVAGTMRLREEADNLALRLNGFDRGILAGPEAAGCILERETVAPAGSIPLWGQSGTFTTELDGMKVRIALDGIFGIAARWYFWPGFVAHAVGWDRPFLSETGYRSFLGLYAAPEPGLGPEGFVRRVLGAYISRELKGRLVTIGPEYRGRASG